MAAARSCGSPWKSAPGSARWPASWAAPPSRKFARTSGSHLRLDDGYVPTMKKGDILGHEFMGEVVDVGRGVNNLKVGDRVVVPFTISCGSCFFCKKELYSLCDNSNPNAWIAEKMMG